MSKNLPYSGTVTGSGQQSLNINWGANPNRSSRSRTYSCGGLNTLTVTQAAASSLKVTGTQAKSTTSGSSAKTVTFSGTANGRYISYSTTMSGGVTVSSAKEYSGGTSGSSFSTSWHQVDHFVGGTSSYDFSVTLNIPANAPVSTSHFTIYTNDITGSAGASRAFTLNITESTVAVTGVDVTPSSIAINVGTIYNGYGLAAEVSPSNATNKEITWSSDNTSKVLINSDGWLRGVSPTSSPVSVWAISDDNPNIKDDCKVSVYNPGSIDLSDNTSVASDATSASMNLTLTNIKTNTISVSKNSSWVTTAVYNSSTGKIDCTFAANTSSQSRDAAITVTGRDMANALWTDTATLSQYGAGSQEIPLNSLSVNGVSSIGDDGSTSHRYDLTYNPSNTTQTGVTWDVVDATSGNSVVGTLVNLTSYSNYCMVSVRPEGQAVNANVRVLSVSNPRPLISGYQSVTVTYNRPLGPIQAEPQNVNVRWNATTDSTPVISYSGDTPTVISYSGIITSASLNSQTNVLTVTCTQNSDPFNYAYGSVVLGGTGYQSYTVNYTQGKADNPYVHTSVNISNMAVSGNAYPMMSANVNLVNGNGNYYEFPDSFDWVLYGYESSSSSSGTQVASGTKTSYSNYVNPNSTYAVVLNATSSVPTGNMTYFKLEVEMDPYTIAPAYAELGDPGSSEITG